MKRTGAARRVRSGFSSVFLFGAALAVALGVTSSTARVAARGAQQPAEDNGIAPSAAAQIEALLREKETRTPAERKIDSQLLYAWRMQQGLPVAPGVQTIEVNLPRAADGRVIVEVSAKALTPNLLAQMNGLSREVRETGPATVEVHLALSQVDQIAADPDVLFVQPRQGRFTSRVGPRPSRDQILPRAQRRKALLESLRTALAGRTSPRQTDSPGQILFTPGPVDVPPQENLVGTGVGSVSSQADQTHRAAIFRALTGANGTGVKIGVLSDDVCSLAAAQASGDLGAVTVLPGQTGNCTPGTPNALGDEGTAMLELIHDMAPGAQLYFATAFTSITSFAQNIRDLRTAGCDIIVDDVGYFAETPLQDGQTSGATSTNGGVVTQAVKDVAGMGVMYFSSAGNSGNLNDGTSGVWEGDFVAGAAAGSPTGVTAGTFHRFTGVQDFDDLTNSTGNQINLFWSDPLGASGNDYDLFLLNAAGTAVLAAGTNIQDGNDDPFELLVPTALGRLVIVKKSTAAVRFLHLNTNRGRLSVATAGQIKGHAATSATFSFGVAATPAGAAFPNAHSTTNTVETFSSDGPRRVLYNGNGSPVTPGNVSSTGGVVLQKPDLTAADGVFVSGAGSFPGQFFGTSAAAPNAAAIMALIKSANPGFTQTQLRAALFATALDIEAPGVDRDSGIGIVMANPPQTGCTFTTAPLLSPGAIGGTGTIPVTASSGACVWQAFSNVPWVQITNGVGVGNGGYLITILKNNGPARSGTVTVPSGTTLTVNQAAAAAPTISFNNSAILPLLDPPSSASPPATVESSLVVSGLTQPVRNVTVSLFVTHTWDADMIISVIAPDGTTVLLSGENGGNGDNYGSACSPATSRTTFDDGATNYVGHASAPFTGAFRPEGSLAAFNGKSGAAVNGTWKLRITDTTHFDTGALQCWSINVNQGPTLGVTNDFNGSGTSDLAVFRPASGTWFINGVGSPAFGLPGDIPVPGDYDGNGVADVAVYRPSTGQWFVNGGVPGTVQLGRSGDVPVPADYDGDTRTDMAVYRTTDGPGGVWYFNVPGQLPVAFGLRGDIPMPGDYDGDGRADLAVYRPSAGVWFIAYAASGFSTSSSAGWGMPGDIPVRADLDNDRRLDFVVFRPSTGQWFMAPTSSAATSFQFGIAGDIPMGMDLDGDGFAELCLWRPSTGTWYLRNRVTASTASLQFGLPGDIPVAQRPRLPSLVVSDFEGDGISDLTVFRPSGGLWFTRYSSSSFINNTATQFGLNGDIPVNSDYDGDRVADVAVYRPPTGQWFIRQSSNGLVRLDTWGLPGDVPMPGDYDGDGRTDIAIFRPSTAQWFIVYSNNNVGVVIQWGLPTDTPFATDVDGDGRSDLVVFRPSTGQWLMRLSTTVYGATIVRQWGLGTDIPMPADFDGDGRSELAVFRPSTGQWLGIDALTGGAVITQQLGLNGDIPAPHDYDGDGKSDPVVFRPPSGNWFIKPSTGGAVMNLQWGLSGDVPR
jgi:subtilisin-like proprotein convertase family protein